MKYFNRYPIPQLASWGSLLGAMYGLALGASTDGDILLTGLIGTALAAAIVGALVGAGVGIIIHLAFR